MNTHFQMMKKVKFALFVAFLLVAFAFQKPAISDGSEKQLLKKCSQVNLPENTDKAVIQLAPFDPTLGKLESVEIEVKSKILGDFNFQQYKEKLTDFKVDIAADIALSLPDRSTIDIQPKGKLDIVNGLLDGKTPVNKGSKQIAFGGDQRTVHRYKGSFEPFTGQKAVQIPIRIKGLLKDNNANAPFQLSSRSEIEVCIHYTYVQNEK